MPYTQDDWDRVIHELRSYAGALSEAVESEAMRDSEGRSIETICGMIRDAYDEFDAIKAAFVRRAIKGA